MNPSPVRHESEIGLLIDRLRRALDPILAGTAAERQVYAQANTLGLCAVSLLLSYLRLPHAKREPQIEMVRRLSPSLGIDPLTVSDDLSEDQRRKRGVDRQAQAIARRLRERLKAAFDGDAAFRDALHAAHGPEMDDLCKVLDALTIGDPKKREEQLATVVPTESATHKRAVTSA